MKQACSRTRRVHHTLFFACLLAIAGPAAAAPPPEDRPAAQTVARLCAEYAGEVGPPFDFDGVTRGEIVPRQNRGDPAFDLACRGWWRQRKEVPTDATMLVRWQSVVAGSLMWQRRPADAQPLMVDAYEHFAALRPPRHTEAAQLAGALAFLARQRGEHAPAIEWSGRGLHHLQFDTEVLRNSVLRARVSHAALLSDARRYDDALAGYRAVLADIGAETAAYAIETGAALIGIANLYRRQDRFAEALAPLQQVVTLRRAHDATNHIEIAAALQMIGQVHIERAAFDEAEGALREAIVEGDRGGIDLLSHRAQIRETLSALLLVRGRIAEARTLAQAAVDILQASPERGSLASIRPQLRLVETELAAGDLAAALAAARRALATLDTATTAPPAETALQLHQVYARVQLELGDAAEAKASLQRGLAQLQALKLSPSESAALATLDAAIARRLGADVDARAALQRADAALEPVHPVDHPTRLQLRADRCLLEADACSGLADALEHAPELPPLAQARLLRALALRARAGGDAAGAEALSHRAIAAALASGLPQLQWQAWGDHAAILADAGRMLEATFFGKQALNLLQQQRTRLAVLGTSADELYLADKGALYRRVSDWLLSQERLPEALEVMRLLKRSEREDFDQRAETAAWPALSLTPLEQALQQAFEAAALDDPAQAEELARLRRLQAARRITADEATRLEQLAAQRAAQRDAAQQRLVAALDELRRRAAAGSPQEQRVHAALRRPADGRTLHVYLLVGERQLSALVIGNRQQRVLTEPVDAPALSRDIAALLDRVQRREPVVAAAQALYRRIAQQLDRTAAAEGAQRIVLWLDGPLRYLPFGLLHDGERYLAQKYVLMLAAPVRDAAGADAADAADAAAAPPPAAMRSLRAFGVTRPHAGLPALPGVAEELCGIVDGPLRGLAGGAAGCVDRHGLRGSGALPGEGDVDEFFTEAALTAAGRDPSTGRGLHVGTHFVLRPGNVSKSWLLMGDGARLPLERLRALPLGRPALVTLSACETAVSADGREIDGLAGTLLDKGAQQVIASLWRVDDRSTARLMRSFYAEVKRTPRDVALALHRAQRAALDSEGGHPYHWAAFTLATVRP